MSNQHTNPNDYSNLLNEDWLQSSGISQDDLNVAAALLAFNNRIDEGSGLPPTLPIQENIHAAEEVPPLESCMGGYIGEDGLFDPNLLANLDAQFSSNPMPAAQNSDLDTTALAHMDGTYVDGQAPDQSFSQGIPVTNTPAGAPIPSTVPGNTRHSHNEPLAAQAAIPNAPFQESDLGTYVPENGPSYAHHSNIPAEYARAPASSSSFVPGNTRYSHYQSASGKPSVSAASHHSSIRGTYVLEQNTNYSHYSNHSAEYALPGASTTSSNTGYTRRSYHDSLAPQAAVPYVTSQTSIDGKYVSGQDLNRVPNSNIGTGYAHSRPSSASFVTGNNHRSHQQPLAAQAAMPRASRQTSRAGTYVRDPVPDYHSGSNTSSSYQTSNVGTNVPEKVPGYRSTSNVSAPRQTSNIGTYVPEQVPHYQRASDISTSRQTSKAGTYVREHVPDFHPALNVSASRQTSNVGTYVPEQVQDYPSALNTSASHVRARASGSPHNTGNTQYSSEYVLPPPANSFVPEPQNEEFGTYDHHRSQNVSSSSDIPAAYVGARSSSSPYVTRNAALSSDEAFNGEYYTPDTTVHSLTTGTYTTGQTPDASYGSAIPAGSASHSSPPTYLPVAAVPTPASAPSSSEEPKKKQYAPYQGLFRSGDEAKAHRKSVRVAPKPKDNQFEAIKTTQREHWVERIYNALVSTHNAKDLPKSVHYQRFVSEPAFDEADLEAAAHLVFDRAVAVYEEGWVMPTLYLKNAHRGPRTDKAGPSLQVRLERIIDGLEKSKALCSDAVEGGIGLRRLVWNPDNELETKEANKRGNLRKGTHLKVGREVVQGKRGREQDEEGDGAGLGGQKRARRQ